MNLSLPGHRAFLSPITESPRFIADKRIEAEEEIPNETVPDENPTQSVAADAVKNRTLLRGTRLEASSLPVGSLTLLDQPVPSIVLAMPLVIMSPLPQPNKCTHPKLERILTFKDGNETV